MSKKRVVKKVKMRRLILRTLSLLAIAYFFLNIFNYSFSIIKLTDEKENLEKELLSLKEEEQNLKTEIIKLQDPEYIARYARENYFYSKDGEYIIKIEKNKEEKKEEKEESNKEITALGAIIAIITIYVIFKSRKKRKA